MGAEASIKLLLLGEDRTASRALRGAGNQADSTGSKFRKMGKFAAVGALGLAAGAVVAGKALFDMGKAAAEDAQQQALLANALKNSAGATDAQVKSTEDWITAQGKAFGVADDKLRPALSDLVRATGDVTEAQNLARLAMDVSAGSGKDLGAVAKALAKAQNGNVAGLARLGIATKDASGQTKTFTQLQDDLAKKFKGAAATSANTFAGKMGRLSLMFDEAKESIGAKLLPVAEDLANWFLRDGLPAIQKFGRWFEANLLPPLKELGTSVMQGLKQAFNQFKAALADARPALELYGSYFKNVLLPVLKKAAEVILPALGLALRATGKFLGALGTIGTAMWNNVLQPVFKGFALAVSKVLLGLSKMFAALGKVPGMGWAKRAAADLKDAAAGAANLAAGINKIPDQKNIKFSLILSDRDRFLLANPNASPFLQGATKPRNATGTGFFSGGLSVVGERGPEVVALARGSRIYDNQTSQRMFAGSTASAGNQPVQIHMHFGIGTDRRQAAREVLGLLKENGVTTGAVVGV